MPIYMPPNRSTAPALLLGCASLLCLGLVAFLILRPDQVEEIPPEFSGPRISSDVRSAGNPESAMSAACTAAHAIGASVSSGTVSISAITPMCQDLSSGVDLKITYLSAEAIVSRWRVVFDEVRAVDVFVYDLPPRPRTTAEVIRRESEYCELMVSGFDWMDRE